MLTLALDFSATLTLGILGDILKSFNAGVLVKRFSEVFDHPSDAWCMSTGVLSQRVRCGFSISFLDAHVLQV